MTTSDTPMDYYAQVAPAHINRLLHFRETHPPQVIRVGGHRWTYLVSGPHHAQPLLLLPGGGGDAEAVFRHIGGLATQFRVIAPNYPPTLRTVVDAVAGLNAILDAETIETTHLLGISIGGMLAQVFVRARSERVNTLVLSHTTVPAAHLATRASMQLRLMRLYPQRFIRWMSKKGYADHLSDPDLPIPDDERDFWMAYFDELYSTRISKKTLVSRAHLTTDFHTTYAFRSSDLQNWQGSILIINASHDDVYDEGERGALLGMYPRAYHHTLTNHTHISAVVAYAEMVETVTEFLHKEGR